MICCQAIWTLYYWQQPLMYFHSVLFHSFYHSLRVSQFMCHTSITWFCFTSLWFISEACVCISGMRIQFKDEMDRATYSPTEASSSGGIERDLWTRSGPQSAKGRTWPAFLPIPIQGIGLSVGSRGVMNVSRVRPSLGLHHKSMLSSQQLITLLVRAWSDNSLPLPLWIFRVICRDVR